MNKSNFLIAIAIGILAFSLWAFANRPEQEPPWPKRIQGFSFAPMRAEQSPLEGIYPTAEQIDADLDLLTGKTHAIRTYTVENVLAEVPRLARKRRINVALGGWIDARLEKNESEIEQLIKIANSQSNVVRVIVGNEVALRGDIPIEQLLAYLDRVRKALKKPVSTAEPWHVWIKHPELADHVDYLAVHMLPYWEGIAADNAVDYIIERINELKVMFPKKPIVIAEVGWPSNGRTRQGAVATTAIQATFLRRFLARAVEEKYIYYVMEAFDQPWKRDTEGAVGAYWGVYDVNRLPKFPFTDPIVAIPEWRILAAISVLIACIALALLTIDSRTLGSRGRGFLALVTFSAASAGVWIVYDYLHQYLTIGSVVVGVLMLFGMIGVIVVLLTEAHEWAEALWVTQRRRPFRMPVETPNPPFVSVHVPAYNEPPEMLIETLNALAQLNYPAFEVIVLDNNTKDPNIWQPVAAHCRHLGQRFRFFHFDSLAGFKAGALNVALAQTSPQAEVVAVIDSDYAVDPDWLRDLVPQFADPKIAIVQAPQDYRDSLESAFKSMCYSEYRGFFFIGMVTRNDRNAIIQHGTMTMIRRSVLDEIGGWGEWCITEDAELGLRIFASGYEATYIPKSYGRGLMPDSFTDYKKQRFRWAYGAVQILRRHLDLLVARKTSRLTYGQRYHFFAGWLPWLADGMNLLFTIGALTWSLAMLIAPRRFDPPLVMFSILPLALFSFKLGKLFYLYRTRVGASLAQTLAAAVAGLALSHTIAKAILTGFITMNRPFFRTPKLSHVPTLMGALAAAREELLLMLALLMAAGGVALQPWPGIFDLHIWIIVLCVQAIPYAAAFFLSLVSVLPRPTIGCYKGSAHRSEAESGALSA